jgi:hypothetical protein
MVRHPEVELEVRLSVIVRKAVLWLALDGEDPDNAVRAPLQCAKALENFNA